MQSRPLVDVSKLGQKAPEKFADTEASWADWSWHYRNYLAAANPAARPAMKFAESCGVTPVDESDVTAQGWRVMSDQLYSSLVGFTQLESPSIVHNTTEGNGLEAWRKLCQRWNRTQAHSRVADKEQLMANLPQPDARLGKAIEDWEVRRKEWEAKHAKTLDDDDAQISLLRLCSGDLRKHLNLHYDSTDSDYAKLRAYLDANRRQLKVKRTKVGVNHNRPGQFSRAYLIPFAQLDQHCMVKIASPVTRGPN